MFNKEQLKEMSCIEIYSEVDKHMTTALMFHANMSDYFKFIGLSGFEKMHELQYFEESIGRRKLHNKVMDIHNKLIPTKGHDKKEVIPKEWNNYTRMDIDDSVLAKFVRVALKQYKEWEEETKEFYEMVCCVFFEKGKIVDYNLMTCYLEGVQEELGRIYRLCGELNGTGYDVLYIIDMQRRICDEFEEKMKHLKV